MSILAFDTCFGAVSVAVTSPASGVHEVYEEMAIGQAERLMPMIDEVMRAAGVEFAQVTRIAVTRGPGSFTGVRTGVAAARALALATGAELVVATSLAVMAVTADEGLTDRGDRALVVVMDARRGGLYVQVFGAHARDELAAAVEVTPEAGVALLAGRRAIAVGSGAEALAQAAAHGQVEVRLPGLQPRAAALLKLAMELPAVKTVTPLYIRQPDAKPPAGGSVLRG
jgi:tRNA threonylcarbamoyladenosine biosynthesis protein TsaB